MESPIRLPESFVICCIFLLCSGKSSLQFPFLNETDVDTDIIKALESVASQGTSMEVAVEEPLWSVMAPWLIEYAPELIASGKAMANSEEELPFNLDLEEAIPNNCTEMDCNITKRTQYKEIMYHWLSAKDFVKNQTQFELGHSAEDFVKHLTTIEIFYIPSENPSNCSSVSSNTNGSVGIGCLVNATDYLDPFLDNVINSFIALVSLGGLVGNGAVIWLLAFQMKRNDFTTYILNLSIADLASLFCLLGMVTVTVGIERDTPWNTPSVVFLISFELFFLTYSASQFLLAAISIDRCVASLFPLWHRCHRPPYLSALVCALIWLLSFLLSAIHFTLFVILSVGLVFQLIVNVLLCTPFMLTSTLTLFIHFCCKTKQRQQGKLITAILLALLAFLVLSLPLNVTYIIHSHIAPQPEPLVFGLACSSLNSSLNPLIYFLIGRTRKKGRLRTCLKAALQAVFKDEEDSLGETNTKIEMHTLFPEVKTEALYKQTI